MEMEIVDVIPKTKEGDIFVMSSNFLKSLLSAPAAAEKRYDTNVIVDHINAPNLFFQFLSRHDPFVSPL